MGETENLSFLWFWDVWTCPRAPKPISFIFGDIRTLQIIQEKTQLIFKHIIWGQLRFVIVVFVGIVCHTHHVLFSMSRFAIWKLRNFAILKLWNVETLALWDQETFVFSSTWIPSTPQHTDSHPCTRPLSWGTRGNILRDNSAKSLQQHNRIKQQPHSWALRWILIMNHWLILDIDGGYKPANCD